MASVRNWIGTTSTTTPIEGLRCGRTAVGVLRSASWRIREWPFSPDDDGFRDVVRALVRDSGFLMRDEDSRARQALSRVREGFQIIVEDECSGLDLRRCQAVAQSARNGDDGFSVKMEWAFLFSSESSAQSKERDIEDYFEEVMPREFDLEEVIQDGRAVTVRGTLTRMISHSPNRPLWSGHAPRPRQHQHGRWRRPAAPPPVRPQRLAQRQGQYPYYLRKYWSK